MQLNKLSLRSVAMAAAVGAALVAQAQTWNNAPNGNWSGASNWLGGVPLPGADLTFFRVGGTSTITAGNDLGNPFAVRSITFNSLAGTTQSLGINNAVGNNLVFTGSNPFITMQGTGFGFISGTAQLDGPVAVSNSSLGGIQLGANILSNGTNPGSLVFSGTPGSFNGSVMILGNTVAASQSTFTGGATLNSGNLLLIGAASPAVSTPFGTGALTINGGTVRTGSAFILGNQIIANSDFVYSGSSVLTLNPNSNLSGNGGLRVRSIGGGVTLQSASTINGNVQIDLPPVGPNTSGGAAGTLALSGANGRMMNVQNFNVRDGGALLLSNSDTGVSNISRINSSASVNLRGGEFRINGQSGTAGSSFTQSVGAVNLEGGANVLSVSVASGAPNVTLDTNSSTRSDRATLLIRASNLGNTTATGVGRVNLPSFAGSLVGGGGAAGTLNVSILPFAIGDTSVANSGSGFVTLGAGGAVRLLATGEYQSNSFAGGDRNVTLSAATAAGAGDSVNALRMVSAGISGGTLNVTSGAVLNQTTNATAGNINFGGAEGVVFATSTFNMNGAFTGSNGMTKAGSAALVARGDNSGLTGTLTINQGLVNFINTNSIPGSGTINTSHAFAATNIAAPGLQYDGLAAGPGTINRDVNIKKGIFRIVNSASAQDLTVSGNISGDGGLTIDGSFSSHAGFMKLTGNNTFTGGVKHWGSNLEISSDANLGNGGAMDLNVGSTAGLRLAGNWNTTRNINQSGAYLMNTNGFNAQWNGVFTSNSSTGQWFGGSTFVKTGAGDLKITNDSSANSNISVRGDTSTGVNTTTGGTLTVMGVAPGLNITLGSTAGGGKLRGNGTVGPVTFAANGSGVLAPGTSVGTLTATTVSMVNLAKYEYELGNPLASDLLTVRATFNTALPSDVINYDMFALSGIAVGNVYTLATFSSTNILLTQFSSNWPVDPGFAGSFEWDNPTSPTALRYRINAVPEPGTMIALGVGLAAMIRRRRAKKSA